MQLFYNSSIETDLFLEKEEHTHATRVLRKQVGDLIWIMNGTGDLFECELAQIGSKKSHVTIKSKQSFDQTNNLHIAIAPTKNNNRMEFFLEKATEIGVKEITPILCDRSERKVIKAERMEKVILSAAKQSKSFHLPIFNPMISFGQFVKNQKDNTVFIAHCEDEENKKELHSYSIKKNDSITILIGPEGDFTEKEIGIAKENGINELSLGETRLRTETAGIFACVTYANQL